MKQHLARGFFRPGHQLRQMESAVKKLGTGAHRDCRFKTSHRGKRGAPLALEIEYALIWTGHQRQLFWLTTVALD